MKERPGPGWGVRLVSDVRRYRAGQRNGGDYKRWPKQLRVSFLRQRIHVWREDLAEKGAQVGVLRALEAAMWVG